MCAACRAWSGFADVRFGKATPEAVAIRRGAAAAVRGDLAFQWCSRRALDATTLHGAGEMSCRSRFACSS
ncbi:hypothetical protein Taro_055807 [Colocasia esculenta]|uniref:Uncharacterized protein n=1 Tax=Colocasia esculenta TaxID=4460 RepID=A0A843XUP5_COLES|nr:hypothetical protein [Colocasia esculenta]